MEFVKTNNFSLSETAEKATANMALSHMFSSIVYTGLADQSGKDRCWLQYEASDLKPEYESLSNMELCFLLEAYTCEILKDLFWGHDFEVNVKLRKHELEKDTLFTIFFYMEPQKGGH